MTTRTPPGPPDACVIYARQSFDRYDDTLAVTRQIDLCREYAAEHGWHVTREYIDNDLSATTGVQRPEFERLLEDSPARIVVWHTDRLVRRTKDLDRVIDTGANVFAIKAGHIDLSTPAGKAVARTITAWAEYEGEQKVVRQRASNLARARRGEPFKGRRAFGYSPDGWSVVPDEGEAFKQAAQGVLDGMSIRAVCRAMPMPTPAGNAWGASEMRRMLVNPRYAALSVHRGEVVAQGKWPALIDTDTHHSLVAILTDPSRTPEPIGPPRRYLLSGIAQCGVCGDTMKGKHFAGKHITKLVCSNTAHLSQKMQPVEDHVVEVVLTALRHRAQAPWLYVRSGGEGDAARASALSEEAVTVRTKLDALAEAFADGSIDAQQLAAASRRLRDRSEAISNERAALHTSDVLPDLLPDDDVRAVWASFDIDRQRAIVKEVVTPVLASPGRGAKVFKPETVTFEWGTHAPTVHVTCPHRPGGDADGRDALRMVREVNDDGSVRGWAPLSLSYNPISKTVILDPEREACCVPDDATLDEALRYGRLVIHKQ